MTEFTLAISKTFQYEQYIRLLSVSSPFWPGFSCPGGSPGLAIPRYCCMSLGAKKKRKSAAMPMLVLRTPYVIPVDIWLQKRSMLILSVRAIFYTPVLRTPYSSMLHTYFPSDRQSLVLRLQVLVEICLASGSVTWISCFARFRQELAF